MASTQTIHSPYPLTLSTTLDPRCTDLPFLLHALKQLEPPLNRGGKPHNIHKTFPDPPRHDVQALSSLSSLFLPSRPDSSAATAVYITNRSCRLFFSSSTPFSESEKEYVRSLQQTVRKFAAGSRGWDGCYEHEIVRVVMEGCRSRVLGLLSELAGEIDTAVVAEDEEVGCVINWDAFIEFVRNEGGGGGKLKRSVQRDWWILTRRKKTRRVVTGRFGEHRRRRRRLQDVEDGVGEVYCLTRALKPPREGEDDDAAAAAAVHRGVLLFMRAIKILSETDLETLHWSELMRYVTICSVICKKREFLERCGVAFTDGFVTWARALAGYADAIAVVCRKLSSQAWRKVLTGLEIIEIIPPCEKPQVCVQTPPPQTSVLSVLQWVEQEHFDPPYVVTADSVAAAFPHTNTTALQSPWTYPPPPPPPSSSSSDEDKDKDGINVIHPEVAILHFLYTQISTSAMTPPYIALGTSDACCWACEVYGKVVHRIAVEDCESGFYAERVYCFYNNSNGSNKGGCVPDGDEWGVPVGGGGGEGDGEVREEVIARVEESVRRVVGRVRRGVDGVGCGGL